MKSPTLELWIGLEQIGLCDKKKKERTLLSFCSLAESSSNDNILTESESDIGLVQKSIAAKKQ